MPRVLLVLFLSMFGALPALAQEALDTGVLARPGHVLLLRHAIAPGVGDPVSMRLGDCASQRNLDAAGRAQAAALGAALRKAGVATARVYSSQWCRALETARLLDFDAPIERAEALNSFFGERSRGASATQALRAWLAAMPRGEPAAILVTHQVNVTALTGIVPASGEGVVLRLLPGGDFAVAGRLRLPG